NAERSIVQEKRLTDDILSAPQARPPESVRNDNDRRAAGRHGITRAEKPARGRLQTQRWEVVAGDERTVDPVGPVRPADAERRDAEREDLTDRGQPALQILKLEP